MERLSVLYLGEDSESATSRHRADAIRRIGAEVTHLNPYRALPKSLRGFRGALHYRTGYRLLQADLSAWLESALSLGASFDVCWVDSGEMLGRRLLDRVKRHCQALILFNHDDPTGPRDGQRFATLRSTLDLYDLCAVVRDENLEEFRQLGAPSVIKVWRSYDEIAHSPPDPEERIPQHFVSDVTFIGRQIRGENRDKFVVALLNAGLDVSIWGDNWTKSRHWATLRKAYRGESLSGREYVYAIAGSKICIGLLSRGNRDQHTTRTMEIPAAGGLLCAERTPEHESLYVEGEEAVFWSSSSECIDACNDLLANPRRRERIRRAGMHRVRKNQVGSEDLCLRVLGEVARSASAPANLVRWLDINQPRVSPRME